MLVYIIVTHNGLEYLGRFNTSAKTTEAFELNDGQQVALRAELNDFESDRASLNSPIDADDLEQLVMHRFWLANAPAIVLQIPQ